MNKKTLLFGLGAIILLVATATILMVLSQRNKPSTAEPQNNQPENTGLPMLQNKPPKITAGQDVNLVRVQNNQNPEEIKKAYEEYLQKSTAFNKPINWSRPANSNDEAIALKEFSQGIEFKISSEIFTLLDEYNYELISCPSNQSTQSYGILINVRLLPEYNNLYENEVKFMQNWEPTMLKDLHTVLFPKENFTPEQLNQPLLFQSGEFRYAEVLLPAETKSSINYEIIDDAIIIASSPACVKSAAAEIISFE